MMLTTEIGENIKRKDKDPGANVWIVKPFKPEQPLDAVKKMIN